jgi:hypothetical protein
MGIIDGANTFCIVMPAGSIVCAKQCDNEELGSSQICFVGAEPNIATA